MNRSKRVRQPGRAHPAPGAVAEFEDFCVVDREDGFWVQPRSGGLERGPYKSLIAAIEDQNVGDDGEIEPGETLAEAEAEMGVADWIDPDTSELAEDSVPHIEEH